MKGVFGNLAFWRKKSFLERFSCFDRVKQLNMCLVNSYFKELFCPKQFFFKQLKILAFSQ